VSGRMWPYCMAVFGSIQVSFKLAGGMAADDV